MNRSLYVRITVLLLFGSLFLSMKATPQSESSQRRAYKALVATADALSPKITARMSPNLRAFLNYAREVTTNEFPAAAHENSMPLGTTDITQASLQPGPAGTIRISNPAFDYPENDYSGYTQHTTSAARCGNAVVVGYEDTAAFPRTNAHSQAPHSFEGVSYSSDGGQHFTALPFLNPGTNILNFLVGNPSVACSSTGHFLYASSFVTGMCDEYSCNSMAQISLSVSTNGGASWSDPAAAVSKDGSHFLDRPWIAVDPSDTSRFYISYTDYYLSGACPVGSADAIEVVSSSDGGGTWSAPNVIEQHCASEAPVTGSNVAVSSSGAVLVAYERFSEGLADPDNRNALVVARSLDHGSTFNSPVKVADIMPIGAITDTDSNTLLQGAFEVSEHPQLAVDRSEGPAPGTVYLSWSDGKNHTRRDAVATNGTYSYADIFVAKSTDSGASFTILPPVSPTPGDFAGPGRDQFFPSIAVDHTGKVAVCYYDRRQDPSNMRMDRFCSTSTNGGASWEDLQASHSRWLPLHSCMDFVSLPKFPDPFFVGSCSTIGQYDSVANDFLLQQPGFFAAFQVQEGGNPNIVGRLF